MHRGLDGFVPGPARCAIELRAAALSSASCSPSVADFCIRAVTRCRCASGCSGGRCVCAEMGGGRNVPRRGRPVAALNPRAGTGPAPLSFRIGVEGAVCDARMPIPNAADNPIPLAALLDASWPEMDRITRGERGGEGFLGRG